MRCSGKITGRRSWHCDGQEFRKSFLVVSSVARPLAGFRSGFLPASLGCRQPGLDFLMHARSGLVCLRGQADDFLEFQP